VKKKGRATKEENGLTSTHRKENSRTIDLCRERRGGGDASRGEVDLLARTSVQRKEGEEVPRLNSQGKEKKAPTEWNSGKEKRGSLNPGKVQKGPAELKDKDALKKKKRRKGAIRRSR